MTLAHDLGMGVIYGGVSRVYDPNAFARDLAAVQVAIRIFNNAGAISEEAGYRERLVRHILAADIWGAIIRLVRGWVAAPSGVCVELALHVYAALEAVEVAWNRLHGSPANENWRAMPRDDFAAILVSVGRKAAHFSHAVVTFNVSNQYNRA